LPFDLPCFFDRFPELFRTLGRKDPNALGCVELTELDPQTIQANMMSAYCVNSFLTQIFSKRITTSYLKFDTSTGATTPRFLTKSNLLADRAMMQDSRRDILTFLYSLSLLEPTGTESDPLYVPGFARWIADYIGGSGRLGRHDQILSLNEMSPLACFEPYFT